VQNDVGAFHKKVEYPVLYIQMKNTNSSALLKVGIVALRLLLRVAVKLCLSVNAGIWTFGEDDFVTMAVIFGPTWRLTRKSAVVGLCPSECPWKVFPSSVHEDQKRFGLREIFKVHLK
jgi:hypothetical protein